MLFSVQVDVGGDIDVSFVKDNSITLPLNLIERYSLYPTTRVHQGWHSTMVCLYEQVSDL